jgi:uncharacterized protein (TIGR03437 family)
LLVPPCLAALARSSVLIALVLSLIGVTALLPTARHQHSLTANAAAPNAVWFKGSTHTHTSNSDGDSSPYAVAARYKELGYNFVVLTDHNRLTEVGGLNTQLGVPNQFLVMQGEEVTDYWNSRPVHLNALNNQTLVQPQHGGDVLATIENNFAAIRQAGGLPYVAHPNYGFAISADNLKNISGPALFEIYNAHPLVNNVGDESHPSVETMWDEVLSSGKVLYGIAADDEHTLYNSGGALPGRAWIMVRAANLDPTSITEAIHRGDFYSTTGVVLNDYQVNAMSLTVGVDPASGPVTIDFLGKHGRLLQRHAGNLAIYTFTGDEMYVRARIVNSAGQVAWTQPVFTARLNADNAILNAASFGNEPQVNKVVARGSIAIATGLGLANTTLRAQRNPDGTFPTSLGGTTVNVAGRAAALYYVSSTQLHFFVPEETELGTGTVVITNADGVQLQTELTVTSVAPGIFTADGRGQGLAVNFLATRLMSPYMWPDNSHRRFIYATGVNAASQVTILINDRVITIEVIRQCRRLPGLDQINVIIPPDMINTGVGNLVIRADGKESNPVTIQL